MTLESPDEGGMLLQARRRECERVLRVQGYSHHHGIRCATKEGAEQDKPAQAQVQRQGDSQAPKDRQSPCLVSPPRDRPQVHKRTCRLIQSLCRRWLHRELGESPGRQESEFGNVLQP
eukprot:CAMPEP_0115731326 /NCGR_PEP_ID=MMETSP0272-20121206/84516_1 /TAXON_ID=71861 /ORGANISM="Scrippsiella trochoidea, Strain CCMP3099" /LENGTH=117 /DNA_ID=CAMNT_0003175137 /DNA_START=34 /DNA_END=391 /DNA_ORIENTATION=+